MFDPATIFVLSTLYMLLSGAILGFMHKVLPEQLLAPAVDWRIGTLLIAGGGVLFASRGIRVVESVILLANACLLWGITLYWRAVISFLGLPVKRNIYLPGLLTLALLTVFLLGYPHYGWRVLISSAGGALITGMVAWELLRARSTWSVVSGRVLAVLFTISGCFMIFRGLYVFTHSTEKETLLLSSHLINALTPVFISLLPTIGTTAFVLLLFERIRHELHIAATTDVLTGLPNRRTINVRAKALFDERLQAASAKRFALAVIDIDHFKSVNDRFGHAVGDLMLQRVAKALAGAVQKAETVGRMGGEEFVALLSSDHLDSVEARAEHLRLAVANAAREQHPEIGVTVSIGVSTWCQEDQSFEDLFRRADRALYVAKQSGRNCVRSSDA
jgi:diguanylate cyclase (GGDEF)-like protein